VARFIEGEDQVFSLFTYVNELNSDIETLQEQVLIFAQDLSSLAAHSRTCNLTPPPPPLLRLHLLLLLLLLHHRRRRRRRLLLFLLLLFLLLLPRISPSPFPSFSPLTSVRQNADILNKINKFNEEGESIDTLRKTTLQSLEARLKTIEEQTATFEDKHSTVSAQMEGLKQGVNAIFTEIGCDQSGLTDQLGNSDVTESNVMQFLGAIEQVCVSGVPAVAYTTACKHCCPCLGPQLGLTEWYACFAGTPQGDVSKLHNPENN